MRHDHGLPPETIPSTEGWILPRVGEIGQVQIEKGIAPFIGRRGGGCGPVVYGSIGNQPRAKEWLIAGLLDHLMCLSEHEASLPVAGSFSLRVNGLGNPFLFSPGSPAPAISFSHARDRTWACLAWTDAVGIDVAYPEEFHGPYPFARVFRPEEMEQAGEFCGGDLQDRAALLWALKEAAVKALGCGFNFFGPLDVGVRTHGPRDGGLLFEIEAGRILSAWAQRKGRDWLAICIS